MTDRDPKAVTVVVLSEVLGERTRQLAKWGEQNHPDGTGSSVVWSFTGPAAYVADCAKTTTDAAAQLGTLTWRDILLEEVAEAFAEEDKQKLRTELIQVAAVSAAWVEAIDRRIAERRDTQR